LEEKEVARRLKSRALWLEKGDDNPKDFNQFANHHKSVNTIWELQGPDGSKLSNFEDLARARVNIVQALFKKDNRVSTTEVVKMATFSQVSYQGK
jgi:hypothetical protein